MENYNLNYISKSQSPLVELSNSQSFSKSLNGELLLGASGTKSLDHNSSLTGMLSKSNIYHSCNQLSHPQFPNIYEHKTCLLDMYKNSLSYMIQELATTWTNSPGDPLFLHHLYRIQIADSISDLDPYISLFGPCFEDPSSSCLVFLSQYIISKLNALFLYDTRNQRPEFAPKLNFPNISTSSSDTFEPLPLKKSLTDRTEYVEFDQTLLQDSTTQFGWYRSNNNKTSQSNSDDCTLESGFISTATNSTVTNSTVTNSTVTNSTAINSTAINSSVINSTAINSSTNDETNQNNQSSSPCQCSSGQCPIQPIIPGIDAQYSAIHCRPASTWPISNRKDDNSQYIIPDTSSYIGDLYNSGHYDLGFGQTCGTTPIGDKGMKKKIGKSLDKNLKCQNEILMLSDYAQPMKGVSFNAKKQAWLAYWTIANNFQMRKFPIKKYGFRNAKQMAIQCRLEAERHNTSERIERFREKLTIRTGNAHSLSPNLPMNGH